MAKSNGINWYKILFYIIVLVLVWWMWKSCNSTPNEKPPQVTPTNTEVKAVKVIDNWKEKLYDSFNLVLNKKEKIIEQGQSKYDDLLADYLNKENDLNSIITQVVPDTCKPYQDRLVAQYNKLSKTSQDKDNASRTVISNLREQNNTQRKFLSQKDTAYKKIHDAFDTCISQQKKLEDYVKDTKPRNQIYAGISMLGNQNKFYNGIGINLGLKTKKGWLYEIGAIQSGITTNYTIGIKRIISFRNH